MQPRGRRRRPHPRPPSLSGIGGHPTPPTLSRPRGPITPRSLTLGRSRGRPLAPPCPTHSPEWKRRSPWGRHKSALSFLVRAFLPTDATQHELVDAPFGRESWLALLAEKLEPRQSDDGKGLSGPQAIPSEREGRQGQGASRTRRWCRWWGSSPERSPRGPCRQVLGTG